MKDTKRRPDKEYRFWLYDPEGDGMTYWRSVEARDAEARKSISAYLDDGMWSEDVEFVSAGEVTHTPQILNKRQRPSDLDEEQCDRDGTYWADYKWMGNYTLEPLPPNA